MVTINDRKYIGYTSKAVAYRFKQHVNACNSGIDNKFYRSLRKHGPSSAVIEILAECESHTEAKNIEKEFIAKYDTYKTGLNSTLGGDGGDTTHKLDTEKYNAYIKKKSILSSGFNNNNCSGLTDEQIVNKAIEFYLEKGVFNMKRWRTFSKTIGYPQNYTKFRFNGGSVNGFLKAFCDELTKRGMQFNELEFKGKIKPKI